MEIITPQEFDFEKWSKIPLEKKKRGNPGTKKKQNYKNVVCAFDIETTRLPDIEQSVMYIWQFYADGFPPVIGRTWPDFFLFLQRLCEPLKKDEYICVFVHNLSYEFTFLSGLYPFKNDEVFALDARKILKCTMFDHVEFRCSYLHSNMSLDAFTKNMGVQHQKLSGAEFDYTKLRYPWTPLSDRELEYCVNDVVGLVEAIKIEMIRDMDTIRSLPATSTGYVRRDAKLAMRRVSHMWLHELELRPDLYIALKAAFRGGNTHANRFYASGDEEEPVIVRNVHSADRSSSYPDVMCNRKFPVSSFNKIPEKYLNVQGIAYYIFGRKRACLLHIALKNVKLRDDFYPVPYLSRDKCQNTIQGENGKFDNGRILSCDYTELWCTDIDFKIMIYQYEADIIVIDGYHARYGYLPQPLIDCVESYYTAKTELKNVEGQEYYYGKAKNKLNALYGMCAQDVCKQKMLYDDNNYTLEQTPIEDLINSANRKMFLAYPWACWVTAWARYELEEGIRTVVSQGGTVIYCDTDSVKYCGEVDWSEYNKLRIQASEKSGACANDPKGCTHYMGVFEQEDDALEFSTMGAKKYVYTKMKHGEKQLVCTIAGVGKKAGAEELQAAGGISAFRSGFTFVKAGGTEAIYNDDPPMDHIMVDGKRLDISRNVSLRDSTYTLGITGEYSDLIRFSHILVNFRE